MSQSISPVLPSNWRVPLFYARFDNSQANSLVGDTQQRTLIIGQATESAPETLVQALSVSQVQALVGANSQLAQMYADYVANDPLANVWLLPLEDAGGAVAAVGSIAIAGSATAAGTLAVYVAGQLANVGVNVGDTAATIATNTAAAINAIATMPATATVSGGTVTLTSDNKGGLGNYIYVGLNYGGTGAGQATPAGITVTITQPTNGTTDPDLGSVSTIVGDLSFDFVVSPYVGSTQTGELTTWMSNSTGRWSTTRQSYGHVFSGTRGAASALTTLGASLNDPHLTVYGDSAVWSPPWTMAAAFAGACAASLRGLASQPLQTLPVVNVLGPQPGAQNSISTINGLLNSGIAQVAWNADGTGQIVRAVTTYQENANGIADTSYLDTETLFTLMAVARACAAMFTSQFPRALLVADGTPMGPGVSIITPKIAMGALAVLYVQLELQGLVQNAAAMAAATTAQIDPTDPAQLQISWAPYLAPGCRVIQEAIVFRL